MSATLKLVFEEPWEGGAGVGAGVGQKKKACEPRQNPDRYGSAHLIHCFHSFVNTYELPSDATSQFLDE